MARENFPQKVKTELALRAAYFCANPNCLRLTAGPRAGSGRGLKTGHAAHICAAEEGGPRYDPDQKDRDQATNGMWMCRECGDLVDKDIPGYTVDQLKRWKRNHEAMMAEVRQKGWSQSIELLRSNHMAPGVAKAVIDLVEDRRVFWAAFDAEIPERVRQSLTGLRYDLTRLRGGCAAGSALDRVIVGLGETIRTFFESVEKFDLSALRCNGGDPDWLEFEGALRALRKSFFFQIDELAKAYSIPLQGEFGHVLPQEHR